jgi:type I restriction enzyme S subunit
VGSDWRTVCLGEVAEIIGGGTPSTKRPENYGGDIPWITPKDLSNYKFRYVTHGERSISEEGLASSSAKLLPKNTVLFTSRAPIGYVALAKNVVATNQGFKSLLLKDGNIPEFFYYLLRHYTPRIESFASGSTFKEVSGGVMKSIEVVIPDVENQKAIAHILGTLDDKIELNQKMNQTLEEIAKAIFKSWFVDFDPVRAKAEGRPTGLPPEISDLFPDELVDSEIGEIPKGWSVGAIADFASLNKKTINPSQSSEIYEHFSIPAFDNGQSPVLDLGTDIKSNKTLVPEGSLLVSKLNPNTPRVWLPNPKDLHEQICSTEFMVYTATDHSNIAFLWGLFTSSLVAGRMEAMVTGTSKSHQRVKPNDVSGIMTVTPDARLVKTYGDTVLPILNRTLVGKSESTVLSELRDTLLPKLISGELRIPDAEKFLEEAGI